MRQRQDNNAPQQKPRSGDSSPYVSPPGEDLKISRNTNERANENIKNAPFEKTDNTSKGFTGGEITDGEAG